MKITKRKITESDLDGIFASFLRKNGALYGFIDNFNNEQEDPISKIKEYKPNVILWTAFAWCITPEGFHYWSEMQEKIEKEF